MPARTEKASQGGSAGLGSAPRLYQRAFDILAGQIAEGALPGGHLLTETGVAQRFGVSRAPARRALAELEAAGLATRTPRGFAVVGDPSPSPAAHAAIAARGDEAKLVSRASWETIYSEVESEIAARISFAAWRVNEAELARAYGVSRTVARDVIGRLHSQGLVAKDDRSRWQAPALTPVHVGELYELRWLLEPVALGKAAPNLSAEFLRGLRDNLTHAIAEGDAVSGATLDRLEKELHVDLLGHCRNQALMQAITQPQSLLIAHRFLYEWTSRLFATEPFLPEHLDIVVHLEEGRAGDAAAALEAHLRVSKDRALMRIETIARGVKPVEIAYLEPLPQ